MKNPFVRNRQQGGYDLTRTASHDEIIHMAEQIISRKFAKGKALSSPADTRTFLTLKMRRLERETFSIIFMDNQHRIIAYEELFYGTLDGASVHPREVVKRVLSLNAAAIILAHNHPSGIAEPSAADQRITERLKSALQLIDVRILDHFIVGDTEVLSFAERGLL